MADTTVQVPVLVDAPVGSDQDRGSCLCLSGGGFRATLFHLGVIQRLNELGVLARLSTITSVSGGSILNGVLATRWSRLDLGRDGVYTNLQHEIARPVRGFCGQDLRTRILLGTRLDPANWPTLLRDRFSVSANFLAQGYEPLYRCKLGDLPAPAPQTPRFIFCATNVQSGACWHLHGGPQARMGDFYSGYCDARHVRVSEAVAASSAFPPGFSALLLRLPAECAFSREDQWGERRIVSAKRADDRPTNSVLLSDGGVYDNLAVEPVWIRYKTLFVSDAGRPFESVANSGQGLITRLERAANISMEQMGAVRKRWLVAEFLAKRRTGAIWALNTLLKDFPIADAQGYGDSTCKYLHQVRTDLDAFAEGEMACLENHGYSLADAALRSYVAELCPNLNAQFTWPNAAWCEAKTAAAALSGSGRRNFRRDTWRYAINRLYG